MFNAFYMFRNVQKQLFAKEKKKQQQKSSIVRLK